MDLTPTTAPAPRRRAKASTRRRVGMGAVFAILLAAMAFILFEGLSNATIYFYNADEAVAHKATLGTSRFRLQGSVVAGTVKALNDGVDFDVSYGGVTVAVAHQGDPPELFQPGIPVVLEGHWQGDVFASDRILVKHTSAYKAEHPDRVPVSGP